MATAEFKENFLAAVLESSFQAVDYLQPRATEDPETVSSSAFEHISCPTAVEGKAHTQPRHSAQHCNAAGSPVRVNIRSSSRLTCKPVAASSELQHSASKVPVKQTARKRVKLQHTVTQAHAQTLGRSQAAAVHEVGVATTSQPPITAILETSNACAVTSIAEDSKAPTARKASAGAKPVQLPRLAGATKAGKESKQPSNKRRKLAPVAPVSVPEIELGREYAYVAGEEPYRAIGIKMHEVELLDPELVKKVHRAQQMYNKTFRDAKNSEDDRYEKAGGKGPDGKSLSRRPDTVARKLMESRGQTINTVACAGHVPGIPVGDRFYLRAEMGVVGLHYPPLSGIDCIKQKSLPPGCPLFATSVMVCGGYEDDADDGDELTYTGQGGNDLLGNRKQIGHQQLVLGNLSLVGNIRLGIPVRVTRRNADVDSLYGCTYIYDGLYNVIRYWKETGLTGYIVYKYRLRRRPNQGDLVTSRVVFGGVGAPKTHSAFITHGLVDRDVSGGKEAVPVVAVNQVDEQIPPFTDPQQIARQKDMKGGSAAIGDSARAQHQKTVEYLECNFLGDGVQQPGEPQLPSKYRGRAHDYLVYLNGGRLPYDDKARSGKKKHAMSTRVQPILYECGPWAKCPLGISCPHAASQRGLQYRMEVFMTANKGWGVRSWDTIPVGAFVMEYTGRILPADISGNADDQDYTFDLAPRPLEDADFPLPSLSQSGSRQVSYVLDAKHEGNVARFLNHSCKPNLYVQPVLSTHHDTSMTKVCFFAWGNIPPLTELTFDYGAEFVKVNLDGLCHCSSASCVAALQHSVAR